MAIIETVDQYSGGDFKSLKQKAKDKNHRTIDK